MAKKCNICDAPAVYRIKDTSDFYCQECAQENFGEVDLLVSVEKEAQRLKKVVEERLGEEEHE